LIHKDKGHNKSLDVFVRDGLNKYENKEKRIDVLIVLKNMKDFFCYLVEYLLFNLLKPNVNYSGRTAPLTSKVAFYIFIRQI